MKQFYFLFAAAIVLIPLLTFAQGSYVPLEPLPQLGSNPTFAQYLKVAFNLSLLAGAALAVLMLTIGGVQYMTSDALGQKEAGRGRIKNAVLGFLLLLSIYVILEAINPNLLTFNLVLQKVGTEYNPIQSGPSTQQQVFGTKVTTQITTLTSELIQTMEQKGIVVSDDSLASDFTLTVGSSGGSALQQYRNICQAIGGVTREDLVQNQRKVTCWRVAQ